MAATGDSVDRYLNARGRELVVDTAEGRELVMATEGDREFNMATAGDREFNMATAGGRDAGEMEVDEPDIDGGGDSGDSDGIGRSGLAVSKVSKRLGTDGGTGDERLGAHVKFCSSGKWCMEYNAFYHTYDYNIKQAITKNYEFSMC